MRILLKMRRPFPIALLVTLCVLGSSGCGGSSEKVVSVYGQVTHKGQAVPGLVLSFVPEVATETGVSTGTTDDNGKYSLTVVKTGSSGAVVGMHKVWVSLPRVFVDPTDKEERAKTRKLKGRGAPASDRPPPDMAAILKTYGNLDKSPLKFEVKGGAPIDIQVD